MFGMFKTFDRLAKLHNEREELLNARSRILDNKQDELGAREKRIAEREEMHMVRLTRANTEDRLVAKHPALAAPYARQERIAEREKMLTVRLTVENKATPVLKEAQERLRAVKDSMKQLTGSLVTDDRVVAKHPLLAAPYGVQDNFAVLRAANIARNPEWFPDGAPPVLPASFRGTELAGEVGEGVEAAMAHLAMLTASAGRICNILKKLERERLGLNGSRSTKEALAEELGDFIICADLVGMDFDIGLWLAVVAKFNATSSKLGMKTMLPTPEQTRDWSQTTYTFKDCSGDAPEVEQTCKACGGDGVPKGLDRSDLCHRCDGYGKL